MLDALELRWASREGVQHNYGGRERGTGRCSAIFNSGRSVSKCNARRNVCCVRRKQSRARVFEMNKRFREERVTLKHSCRPGQAHRVITPSVIAVVEVAVRNDQRRKIEVLFGSCWSRYRSHIPDRPFEVMKICAQCVPQSLTEEQKFNRISTSLQKLEQFMLKNITSFPKLS